MSSSMLNVDRRRGSARRGGMTVLGKVTVPKPINLPSQRLENHGLDPHVEIVPKGTLSWGNQSSSSAPNAWGSPQFSPSNTDGIVGSPRNHNGRPSSGGSGTRPSTAGSDKSHEPVPNAWGPSSRPSSASGVLASNKTLMATTRPHSAETRTGSSQLSRFAESMPENSVAWVAAGTAEKLGASSSQTSGFTLSSGDFPTLGAEKNAESHGLPGQSSPRRPVSASGRVATTKERAEISPTEDESIDGNTQSRTVDTWKRDSSPYVGGGAPPMMGKWHGEAQPYPNHNMPPQQFDPWHGTHVRNPPDGVWYRGGPSVVPPCVPPGPPGSYPLEPFTYYHPQLPVRPLANSQMVTHPGSDPGGYHPNNGNSYRPHMSDPYIRPVMPMRTGVYPGPMPYDCYYGAPHVGFCHSSERDAPVMGVTTAPSGYNRYPNQNAHPDAGNFHARPGGYAPTSTPVAKEQSGLPHDTHREPYKVLLKQHDGWEGNDGNKRETTDITNMPLLGRGNHAGTPGESDWGVDYKKVEQVDIPKSTFGGEASLQSAGTRGGYSSAPIIINLPEITNKPKLVDDNLVRKPEPTAILEGSEQVLPTKRNPTLMDKIEGLNSKSQISDGQYDGPVPTGGEEKKKIRVVNAKADRASSEAGTGIVYAGRALTSGMLDPISHDVVKSTGDNRLQPTAINGPVLSKPIFESQASASCVLKFSEGGETAHSHPYKRSQGIQGRVDYQGKGRYKTQESEEWRKKSLVANSSTVVPATDVETHLDIRVLDYDTAQGASEKANSNLLGKAGEELHSSSALEPSDYNAQRAKMREIAMQRAKQLQEEEEERTREQKAKALAKLEELNRRTLAESWTLKLDHAPPSSGTLPLKQENIQSNAGPTATGTSNSSGITNSVLGCKSDSFSVMSKDNTNRPGESTALTSNVPLEALQDTPQGHVFTHNSSLQQEVNIADLGDHQKAALQVHDSSFSKHNQGANKRKQNIPPDENLSDKIIPSGTTGNPMSNAGIVGNINASSDESNLPSYTSAADDPALQHKKKNNRSSKNKHKVNEVISTAHLQLSADENPAKHFTGSKQKTSESAFGISSVRALALIESVEGQVHQDAVPSTDQGWSLPTEEVHSRVGNQWKQQPSRRMARNTQSTKSAEKFHSNETVVWAPVRSLNNNDASEEASNDTTVEACTSSAKSGYTMQTNQKSRRAEMERYVPKPVAKELSLQENTQQPLSPSVNKAVSDETSATESGSLNTKNSGPDGLTIQKEGYSVEPKDGESKHNKHHRAHGLQRQRGSTESALVKGSLEESSFSSDSSGLFQKPIEQKKSPKLEKHSLKRLEYSDNGDDPNNLVSTEPVTGSLKDHRIAGKGKQHTIKGYKSTAYNHNAAAYQRDLRGGETDKVVTQSSGVELSQSNRRNTSKENHGVGEHSSSHWQPKSYPYSTHQPQGNMVNGGQRIINQIGRTSEKEFLPQGDEHFLLRDGKDTSACQVLPRPHPFRTRTKVSEVPNVLDQEGKRERKGKSSFKEGVHSQNQGPSGSSELVPAANVDNEHFLGLHRQGRNSGPFDRGQEVLHGSQNPVRQVNSKQNHQPANSDSQRRNSHYEYQPVGPYKNKPNESFEEGSRAADSRYSERGQTHSRRGRGNFYGRNSGIVHVTSYGNEE